MRLLDRLLGRSSQDTYEEAIEGYCFKCRARRSINNAAEVQMKNGRLRTQGECAVCGGGMSKMMKG